MILLDNTIVNVALPAIQSGLRITTSSLEWVISGYALSLAAFIPVTGALGDRYGRKRILIAGTAIFGLGSLGCALSGADFTLIAFRIVQGCGGAAILALSLSIITETFPAERRAGAIGVWAAISGLGFGAGPVIGGVLLGAFHWSSVFWVNVPIAAVTIVGALIVVGESRNPVSRRFDLPGVASSGLGLAAITIGMVESSSHQWGSLAVAGPLAVGVALLGWFARWERRCPDALLPPTLLRARSFISACAIYMTCYAAMAGVLFYVTLLYQNVYGWSALQTGLSWLVMNIPFLSVAQLAGRLDRRFPTGIVVGVGCLAAAVGMFVLSKVGAQTSFAVTAIGYVLAGGGFGAMNPGVTHIAMRDVPAGVSGAASAIVNASRQVGTSVGLAVLGAIGVSAAVADWTTRTERLPAAVRELAAKQGQNVGGAHLDAVSAALGSGFRHAATEAFTSGFHLALGVAALCVLLAGCTALLGLRQRKPVTA